ncbi:MAG: response regulator transcription factor [Chloroflexi bacterium]|nr:response regulator transcription factor [Chloroflexota bacterium]MDA1271847.1 response regulator transcription factor [Chloroflexota bacterium]
MNIRIFLIDEHRPAREILARRLSSLANMDVVGSTGNGEEAIRDIAGLSPDVVLIDTKMKRADGIDLCRRALAADKQATVAILTSYLDPNERRQAYQAGVNGYLLKDADTAKLAKWITLAVKHGPERRNNLEDSRVAESSDS